MFHAGQQPYAAPEGPWRPDGRFPQGGLGLQPGRRGTEYVTGSHALKVGVGDLFGYNKQEFYTYRRRVTVNFDIYNALNVDTILHSNNAFAAWQRPTALTQARFIKVGGQIDF